MESELMTSNPPSPGLHRQLSGKEPACQAGDVGSIPGLGGSPGEENGNPLQCSCLGNPMGRGAWQARVHGVAMSPTQLRGWRAAAIHHYQCAEAPLWETVLPTWGTQARNPSITITFTDSPLVPEKRTLAPGQREPCHLALHLGVFRAMRFEPEPLASPSSQRSGKQGTQHPGCSKTMDKTGWKRGLSHLSKTTTFISMCTREKHHLRVCLGKVPRSSNQLTFISPVPLCVEGLADCPSPLWGTLKTGH